MIVIGKFNTLNHNTVVTGKYDRNELTNLIEEHKIDLILIPSVCPETFSYTTSEAMMMDVPLACFNIGAQAERIAKYKKGLIISKISAKAAVSEIIRFLDKKND